ncbi:MAG: hypothetical protein K2K83_06280, partial [Rikenella sp.]|nr:hypothetical protein [Rikenella sp.]
LIARAVERPEPMFRIPRWMVRAASRFAPALAALTASGRRYDGSAILNAIPFRYSDLSRVLDQVGSL